MRTVRIFELGGQDKRQHRWCSSLGLVGFFFSFAFSGASGIKGHNAKEGRVSGGLLLLWAFSFFVLDLLFRHRFPFFYMFLLTGKQI